MLPYKQWPCHIRQPAGKHPRAQRASAGLQQWVEREPLNTCSLIRTFPDSAGVGLPGVNWDSTRGPQVHIPKAQHHVCSTHQELPYVFCSAYIRHKDIRHLGEQKLGSRAVCDDWNKYALQAV